MKVNLTDQARAMLDLAIEHPPASVGRKKRAGGGTEEKELSGAEQFILDDLRMYLKILPDDERRDYQSRLVRAGYPIERNPWGEWEDSVRRQAGT